MRSEMLSDRGRPSVSSAAAAAGFVSGSFCSKERFRASTAEARTLAAGWGMGWREGFNRRHEGHPLILGGLLPLLPTVRGCDGCPAGFAPGGGRARCWHRAGRVCLVGVESRIKEEP